MWWKISIIPKNCATLNGTCFPAALLLQGIWIRIERNASGCGNTCNSLLLRQPLSTSGHWRRSDCFNFCWPLTTDRPSSRMLEVDVYLTTLAIYDCSDDHRLPMSTSEWSSLQFCLPDLKVSIKHCPSRFTTRHARCPDTLTSNHFQQGVMN